jgi:glycosyltransferase involved in cell wall biosynthesis
MEISLIITTYNWKEALQLSLQSALAQTLPPVEIVIADDGSGQDTAELVQRIAQSASVPVFHSWQEDQGFRAARSRNLAIARARGEYIILIDGDMVLEPHFIADHCAYARPGYFVQGSRALLSQRMTATLLASGARSLRLPPVLNGLGNKKNMLRSALLAKLFSTTSRRLPGIKSCNFAFWKEDAVRVNGFDEDFVGWGREDSEFAARLLNSGSLRQNLRFHAIGYHLYHPMSTRERLAANDVLLRKTIEEKRTWCERGINLHLP